MPTDLCGQVGFVVSKAVGPLRDRHWALLTCSPVTRADVGTMLPVTVSKC